MSRASAVLRWQWQYIHRHSVRAYTYRSSQVHNLETRHRPRSKPPTSTPAGPEGVELAGLAPRYRFVSAFGGEAARTGTYGATPDSSASFGRSLGPIRCIRVPGWNPHICLSTSADPSRHPVLFIVPVLSSTPAFYLPSTSKLDAMSAVLVFLSGVVLVALIMLCHS